MHGDEALSPHNANLANNAQINWIEKVTPEMSTKDMQLHFFFIPGVATCAYCNWDISDKERLEANCVCQTLSFAFALVHSPHVGNSQSRILLAFAIYVHWTSNLAFLLQLTLFNLTSYVLQSFNCNRFNMFILPCLVVACVLLGIWSLLGFY